MSSKARATWPEKGATFVFRHRGFAPEVISLPGAAVMEKARLVPKDGAPGFLQVGFAHSQDHTRRSARFSPVITSFSLCNCCGGWGGCPHFIGEAAMAQRG